MHLNRFGKAHRLPRETLLRVRKVRGLRSIFCVFRLPTNDHISSTSTSSARQIMTSPSLEDKALSKGSLTLISAASFFQLVHDRGRADLQHPCCVPDATALETHVHDLVLDLG